MVSLSNHHQRTGPRNLELVDELVKPDTIELRLKLPPQQLSMTMTADRVQPLADVELPEGYVLRGYRHGDEEGWLELLHRGGFLREWDRARIDAHLADPERQDGSRVVYHHGALVAATFASRQTQPVRAGILDYVVSHPEHRGRGLGRAVCTAVMRFMVRRGYRRIALSTDDWRLPAIGLYLSLGFEPEMTREDMPARWAAVEKKLREWRSEHS